MVFLEPQHIRLIQNHEWPYLCILLGMRGGHQLIIDSANGTMYLYGGWDGFEDLSDLWAFDIKRNVWSLIHERSETFDGPSPRSCHKMVYDSSNAQIFTLGRYLDSASRTRDCIKVSLIYAYKWVFNRMNWEYFPFSPERFLSVRHEN